MGSPSANKRKSREQAFIILFEKSFNTELSVDEIMDIAIETEVISKDKMTADIVKRLRKILMRSMPPLRVISRAGASREFQRSALHC